MSNTASSNVIPMRDPERPSPNPQAAQFERLLKECQDLAVDRVSRAVAAMLDKAEDALWAIADHTHDRELRDLYISAKDKLLGQRKTIESEFRANYQAEIVRRSNRERKQSEAFSQYELAGLELGLVNDEDLEETLKVNDMSAKLRRYCEEELNALDQRVGVLLGDANLHGEDDPFSPQVLCNAFKQTCRQLEPNMKIRVIFHKLFDDHVLDEVRSIYKDINALLIQRSILPKIRYGMRRAPAGMGARPGLPAAALLQDPGIPGTAMPGVPGMGIPGAGIPGAGVPGVGIPGMGMRGGGGHPGIGATGVPMEGGYDAGGAGGEQDFFAVLQGLLARSSQAVAPGVIPAGGGMPGGGAAGGGAAVHVPGFPPILSGAIAGHAPGIAGTGGAGTVGVPVGSAARPRLLQGAELIGSLTRLQHGDVTMLPAGVSGLDLSALSSGTTNVVRELKAKGLADNIDHTDGATMDIVAMLFDQIFGDPRVPDALKALIGRLQIPVVKVAMLDKKFFSKKSHPARRMLDTLGEFALGLDEKFDQASPVYKKIEEVVQRLLEGFEDDIDIFDTLQAELLSVIREENKRAELAAKEVARKIAYKERLEVGKAMAQLEIKRRVESARVPQLIVKFLAEHWLKLLLLTYARHGHDSDAWKTAAETMDLLVWSVTHKKSVDDRRKLATMLPGLLKRLQTGLRAVSNDEAISTQFFTKLMRLHTKVISGGGIGGAARPKPVASQLPAPTRDQVRPKPADIPTLTDALPVGETHPSPTRAHKDPLGLEAPPVPALDFGVSTASEREQPVRPSPDTTPAAVPASAAERSSPEHQIAAEAIEAAPRPAAKPAGALEIDEEAEASAEALSFSNVTIKNPFGDGDIEVEEISLSDLPGGLPNAASPSSGGDTKPKDHETLSVTSLKEGAWLEFRDDEDRRTQAKLSYISPLKGTYLFVNRQGGKVGEYSLYQLAREFRTGRAVVLEAVPLIDRAMSSLVGALKKNTK